MPLEYQEDDDSYNCWNSPLIDGCPKSCELVGPNPVNWTHIHTKHELETCDKDLLFDINVQGAANGHGIIRTCTLDAVSKRVQTSAVAATSIQGRSDALEMVASDQRPTDTARNLTMSNACGARQSTVSVILSGGPRLFTSSAENGTRAVNQLADISSTALPVARPYFLPKLAQLFRVYTLEVISRWTVLVTFCWIPCT